MHYLIGLGNPEEEYGITRHNAGKILLHAIAHKLHSDTWKHVSFDKMSVAHVRINTVPVTLALSDVYMNESGVVVRNLYKQSPETIIVVHDDLDLALGTFKLSRNKGDGGHNGVASINQLVTDKEILRLRIGISPVDTDGAIRRVAAENQADYVLKPFTSNEKEIIEQLADTILALLAVAYTDGIDKAMTLYNK